MQALLALLALVLGIVGRTGPGAPAPLFTVFVFAALGLLAWVAILVASAFRHARAVENYELELALRSGESERTIFASEADARPAARRLRRVYKWVLPIVAGLLGLLLVLHGLDAVKSASGSPAVRLGNPRYLAGLFASFAFAGFVLGRYLLGMSTQPSWSLLRGGATYLIGTVYLFALMALTAGAAALGWDAANGVARWVAPAFALLVGAEFVLSIVLDLYRPKAAEETPRPAFDSRLLALLASPGDIVQSLNEAVNYQFGFEITRSWFWRLLSRSFGWLVLFGVAVLVLLSSVAVIEPHEMGLKTSLGRLQARPLEPGIRLTLPWPLARVDKFDVTRVRELVVGSHDHLERDVPLLWTNQHGENEDRNLIIIAGGALSDDPDFGALTAPPPQRGGGRSLIPLITNQQPLAVPAGAAPPVALAAADVVVQWKIDAGNLIRYATRAEDPEQRLRHLASAVVTREMLQHEIDSAIGVGRPRIAKIIETSLRQAVEAENLGITIVWVGLANVHPPQQVAEDFNGVAANIQFARNLREQGMQEQTRILTEAAGSVTAAERIVAEHDRLVALRQQYHQIRSDVSGGKATQQQLQEAHAAMLSQQAELERLVQQAGGTAGTELIAARHERWQQENGAIAQAVLQPVEYAAYRQAPRYYSFRRYLEILAQALPDKRKFMLMTDDKSPDVQLNLEETIDALTNLQIAPRAGQGRE